MRPGPAVLQPVCPTVAVAWVSRKQRRALNYAHTCADISADVDHACVCAVAPNAVCTPRRLSGLDLIQIGFEGVTLRMCPGLGSQTTTFGGLQAENSQKRIRPFEKVHNFWGDFQLQKFHAADAPAGGAASIFVGCNNSSFFGCFQLQKL